MSKQNHSSLLLLFISFVAFSTATANAGVGTSKTAVNFIQASCKATTYPAQCVRSLSAYANAIQTSPQRLAETALTLSLNRALSTKTFVSRLTRFKGIKPRQYQAIKDCVEEIGDTVDRLTKSVQEFKQCNRARGGNSFWYHMSNVQTWTSAALTDETTCSDGFAGRVMDGRIKSSVRAQIVNMGRETSNALALINHFASKKH